MLPPRCSQPPCRNIETSALKSDGTKAGAYQNRAGTNATCARTGSMSYPRDISQKNISTLAAMRRLLTTGAVRRGLWSETGSTGGFYLKREGWREKREKGKVHSSPV